MAGSQSYLGIKNGVVVCVNSYVGYELAGEFYHGYSTEPVEFSGAGELLSGLESLFNLLNFPYAATNMRDFSDDDSGKKNRRVRERPLKIPGNQADYRNHEEIERVMSDRDILSKHGDEGTFIVRVQQRQNSSWQGRITWVDEDKTVYFRSVWEMMKLIDAALESGDESDSKTAGWD